MNLYEPLLERDESGIRTAIGEFRRSHTSAELFAAIARFAVLAYAPSQHAKHAVISCRSAWEIRDDLGDRFDDVITECAIYAAGSRQPWSEPPFTDPPAIDADQRGDIDELRDCVATGDRLRAERWLAKRYRDSDFSRDYFAVASDDYEDLGHKLIVAVTAWKLASIFGEQGAYASLRIGIREMTAYRGSSKPPGGDVVANMIAKRGDIESAHAVFHHDAAREAEGRSVVARAPARRAGGAPVYRLARDYGAYLKSFSVANRLGDDRIIAAAKYNLDHATSFEEFSFA
ncbi:MAG: hypothetical protein M3041_12175 [Acidobacteriota bacterium]|nr:hypothetical protein [Acidobacteriota bacterium]